MPISSPSRLRKCLQNVSCTGPRFCSTGSTAVPFFSVFRCSRKTLLSSLSDIEALFMAAFAITFTSPARTIALDASMRTPTTIIRRRAFIGRLSKMESSFHYHCVRVRLEPTWILLGVKANGVSRGRVTVNKMSLDLHIPETVHLNPRGYYLVVHVVRGLACIQQVGLHRGERAGEKISYRVAGIVGPDS